MILWPRLAALLFIFACAFGLPCRGSAQVALQPNSARMGVRLHVGMWTTHLNDLGRGLEANWLVALGWRSLYGGTFINSFGDRAFAAGLQRPLARSDDGSLAAGVGYRLGVVTGYDERLMGLAGRIPVFPAVQLTGDMAMGRTGVELAWAGKVATMGPFMRVRN